MTSTPRTWTLLLRGDPGTIELRPVGGQDAQAAPTVAAASVAS